MEVRSKLPIQEAKIYSAHKRTRSSIKNLAKILGVLKRGTNLQIIILKSLMTQKRSTVSLLSFLELTFLDKVTKLLSRKIT